MSIETLTASSHPNPAGHRDLTIERALAHLGEVHLVDVRETDEFVGPLGHIPGAELVPLATVTAVATGWDKGAPRVIVCRSGGRSGRAAAALAQMGFTHVYNLGGGMLAWEQTGLPRVGQGTAFQELAGEVQLAYAAMAGGDPAAAQHRLAAATGGATDQGGLARAIEAVTETDHLAADAAAAWKHRLQERLRALE